MTHLPKNREENINVAAEPKRQRRHRGNHFEDQRKSEGDHGRDRGPRQGVIPRL